MIVFASKLYQLSDMEKCSKSEGVKRRDLLHTARKYQILLCFAILSSWIVFAYLSISNVITKGNHKDNSIIESVLVSNIACIDSVVNVICLYLQYPFNEKYYDKYCGGVSKCCMYFIARRIPTDDEIVLGAIATENNGDKGENGVVV